MQGQSSHTDGFTASAAEVAASPHLLLDMARSVLAEHQRIINEQRTEIVRLRAALKSAAALWIPEGTVIQ